MHERNKNRIKILSILTALQFLFIMYIETFITVSEASSKLFGISYRELSNPLVVNLFRNQGVYNGVLGLLLLIFAIFYADIRATKTILAAMCAVAVYGGFAVDKSIILRQGFMPFITLAAYMVFYRKGENKA